MKLRLLDACQNALLTTTSLVGHSSLSPEHIGKLCAVSLHVIVQHWLFSDSRFMQVGKADWQAVQQGPPWAVDSWGLGCLIQEVYRGAALTRTEELRDTSSIPKSVLPVSLPSLLTHLPVTWSASCTHCEHVLPVSYCYAYLY